MICIGQEYEKLRNCVDKLLLFDRIIKHRKTWNLRIIICYLKSYNCLQIVHVRWEYLQPYNQYSYIIII